jgi:hypothetical protein
MLKPRRDETHFVVKTQLWLFFGENALQGRQGQTPHGGQMYMVPGRRTMSIE